MINSIQFFNDNYYSKLSVPNKVHDGKSVFIAIMTNNEYIFGFYIRERYTIYYFNMLKPEVYAIDCDPPYIPLSNEDIDILMDKLIKDGIWEKLIEEYQKWIDDPDDPSNRFYTTIDPIPLTPPDYHLIWENGYTGKEDISMILHEDT